MASSPVLLVSPGQMIQAGTLNALADGSALFSPDTGNGGNYLLTYDNTTPYSITALSVGQVLNFKAVSGSNPSSTISIVGATSTLGPYSISCGGQPLTSASIVNGQMASVMWDGTEFQLAAGGTGNVFPSGITVGAPASAVGIYFANSGGAEIVQVDLGNGVSAITISTCSIPRWPRSKYKNNNSTARIVPLVVRPRVCGQSILKEIHF